jgi:capsular exopolysaccharide synthesis family protein
MEAKKFAALPAAQSRMAGDSLSPPLSHRIDSSNTATVSLEEADSIEQFWFALWASKWLIVGLALAGAMGGIFIALLQRPIYRAHTSIELEIVNQNYLDIKEIEPTAVNYGDESYMQTQIRILESESLKERTIQRLNREAPEIIYSPPPVGTDIIGRFSLVHPAPESRRKAIAYIVRTLKVKGSGLTRLIEIACGSPHPKLAADFANVMTAEYIEYNLEARWASMQRTGNWLNEKVKDLKVKLEKAEANLQAYSRSSGLVFTAEKDNIAEENLRHLESELAAAHDDVLQKQSRYEQVRNSNLDSLPEILDNGAIREYQTRLSDLGRQLAEARVTMEPPHYKVRRLEAQIAETRADLARARDNVQRRIANEYEIAKRRENMLQVADAQQRSVVSEQLAKTARYNLLKRDVDSTRQTYDAMLQKINEINVAGAMPITNVRIVDAARPASAPALPSASLNSSLGLLAGLLAGVAGAFMKRKTAWHVKCPGEASALLGVREIGAVPSAKYDRIALNQRLRKRRVLHHGLNTLKELNTDGAFSPSSSTAPLLIQSSSITAEAYRAAVTSILFSSEEGVARTIVFASANPQEGKTTSVSNLGIALAELGKRVLIMDGDVRRPRMHDVFGIPNGPGLSDLLSAESIDFANISFVRETWVPGLYLLPAGDGSTNALNHLYSSQMARLLEYLRQEFDAVLIDSPPVLLLRDARMIGKLADGVVLVVRAQQTSGAGLMAAAEKFRQDGTPILGILLNDWNPRDSRSHYGSEYVSGYAQYYKR